MEELRREIEAAWAGERSPERSLELARQAVDMLDRGELRVAVKTGGEWVVNAWLKRAILLCFRHAPLVEGTEGSLPFRDCIPLKHDLARLGIRVVPPGAARYGAFLEPGCVLMPGYVNIGARVGAGTMIDTWATVGSCAQVGRGVHLSGGVGIGGVLEPPSGRPVIVEDGAFIGSRSVIVEGVIVEEEAVLGANVVLTASTPVIDVTGERERVHRGRVPARSVVIPGTRRRRFPAGEYEIPCALIIGRRKASTDRKTSLNEVLRAFAPHT